MVEPLVVVSLAIPPPPPLDLDTVELVGLTEGMLAVVVLLTTGSLRLDLPRLPLPRLRLLVVAVVILRPPEEREGEVVREGRGDSVSVCG